MFIIVTAIGLFFPSTVRVSRAIDIYATSDTLHHFISDVKYWKLWMQGAEKSTIQFLSAKTAGAGTVARIGNDEVGILSAAPNSILIQWKGIKGNIQNSGFELISYPAKNITTVQWWFEQHINWYPWERFASIMNDKILGPSMEQSLNNLKLLAEKN